MRSSTDKIFAHFGQFFALLPLPPSCSLKTHRIRILKKLQKTLEISSFYTSAAQMTIIMWYMVPDISTATDNFFCHLGPSWPIHSRNSPKIKNTKKMKKNRGDIIILHNCTKKHDHRLYCSWHMARDRCNCYFSFWAIFCTFTP